MVLQDERRMRINRVTEKAWQTFHLPPELCKEHASQAFYRIACVYAEKEFWSGEWCDLPKDEDGQIYWLQQYWGFVMDRALEQIERSW